ncbi:MAG: MerR family transcriptional regulator, partial [Thermomicrobiales bacterium]
GLVAPSRTTGNLRLYSDRDIERLRQVKYLVEEHGLNLAGVQLALELTARLRETRSWLVRQAESNAVPSAPAASLHQNFDEMLATLGFIDEPPPE